MDRRFFLLSTVPVVLHVPTVLFAAVAASDPLTRSERDFAMSDLHASRKLLLDAVQGLSAAQATFKEGPERWSVLQVVEHLVLTEDMFQNMIQNQVMKTPAVTAGRDERNKRDALIGPPMQDRASKAQAPEQLRPASKYRDLPSAVAAFKQRRDAIIRYLETTNDPLRAHVQKMGGQELDAYQHYLFLSGHTTRHVGQINEIKAAANFPRR